VIIVAPPIWAESAAHRATDTVESAASRSAELVMRCFIFLSYRRGSNSASRRRARPLAAGCCRHELHIQREHTPASPHLSWDGVLGRVLLGQRQPLSSCLTAHWALSPVYGLEPWPDLLGWRRGSAVLPSFIVQLLLAILPSLPLPALNFLNRRVPHRFTSAPRARG
jgi:hypothetical protein